MIFFVSLDKISYDDSWLVAFSNNNDNSNNNNSNDNSNTTPKWPMRNLDRKKSYKRLFQLQKQPFSNQLGITVILQWLFPTGFGQHNKIEVIIYPNRPYSTHRSAPRHIHPCSPSNSERCSKSNSKSSHSSSNSNSNSNDNSNSKNSSITNTGNDDSSSCLLLLVARKWKLQWPQQHQQ